MIKICTSCKGHFVAQGRSVTCLPCWKESRGYETTRADQAHIALSEAYGELKIELGIAQVEVIKLRAELDLAKVKAQGAPVTPSPSASSNGLDAKLLRKILLLCHPDKHGNSESATEVTKILLQMRGKK